MNLYANLSLEREPFSNSPDPNFLHETKQHATCLQELEISLRLRRGLNVITGDIGTGKTTLCRSLLRTFAEDREVDMHLLLDPHFGTPEEFLRVILSSVSRLAPDPDLGLWELKEALKQQLYRLGMVENRLVVLIIDEGQKMSLENLELLREMLNYETNSSKLLQIVIFAQRELEPLLAAMPNLVDRINVRKRLRSLTLSETRQMIRHRLHVAASVEARPQVDFSEVAICAIHMASGGSPRKIVRLCHMAMLEMLVRGRTSVGMVEARAAIRPDGSPRKRHRPAMAVAVAMTLCLGLGSLWYSAGPGGPVLGPGPADRNSGGLGLQTDLPAADAAPAGLLAEPRAEDMARPDAEATAGANAGDNVEANVGDRIQPKAEAASGAESRSAGLGAEGLTLLPATEEAKSAPAGLTLQPQRDVGPSLRSPIAHGSVVQDGQLRLRVAAPRPSDRPVAVALADEDGQRGLFRTVAFSMAGRQ